MDTLVVDRDDRGLGLQRLRDALPGRHPPGRPPPGDLLRQLDDHPRARPARPLARGPGEGPGDRRDPPADRPPGDVGAARPRRRGVGRRPSRRSTPATCSGSGPATASRSTGSSSRATSAVDESMLTGEAMPVAKGPGDEVIGATAQHDRHVRLPGDARRGATRPSPGSWPSSSGPRAPRRRSSGWPTGSARRSCRPSSSSRRLTFAAWFAVRAGAAADARADRVHRRRHHRLPVRDGPRHPDGDHGRDGPRRGGRDPVPRRRGARGGRHDRRPSSFDKTGTLTAGRPEVVAIEAAPGVDPAEVLDLAASLERGSEHPLGGAIVAPGQRATSSASGRAEASRQSPGLGVDRPGRRPARSSSAARGCSPTRGIDTAAARRRGRRARPAPGERVAWVAIDGARGRRHRDRRPDQARGRRRPSRS